MNKAAQLQLLSKYRTELMGVGAICILLCHSVGRDVLMPGSLSQILSYGNIGVDIFLLLSGMGMFYSLSRCQFSDWGGVICWYKTRYIKLLVPYTVVIVPIYIAKCLFGVTAWGQALIDYTTISFWTSHRSAWFVALIIPLYLFSPLLYRLCNKGKKTDLLVCISVCIACVTASIIGDFDKTDGFIYNLQFVLKRVPSFIIGMWLAPYVKQGICIKWTWLLWLLVVSFVVKFIVPVDICPYFLMVLPMLMILTLVFEARPVQSIGKRLFRFMGNISLESYLTNVALPSILALIPFEVGGVDLNYGNYLYYGLIVFVGLGLSVVCKKASEMILARIEKK